MSVRFGLLENLHVTLPSLLRKGKRVGLAASLLLLVPVGMNLVLPGCGPKAPVEELTDAQAALKAAREAGVDTSSTEYLAAEALLNEALKNLRDKNYHEAGKLARDAKAKADDLLKNLLAARRPPQGAPPEGDLGFDSGSLGEAGEVLQPGEHFVPDERLALKRVYFEFDDYALADDARDTLRAGANWLFAHPDAFIQIEGHCDERGTSEYNMALGHRRAESAREFLVALGVPSHRLRTISYGEEIPLDERPTEDAWARNRRAQFVRLADRT